MLPPARGTAGATLPTNLVTAALAADGCAAYLPSPLACLPCACLAHRSAYILCFPQFRCCGLIRKVALRCIGCAGGNHARPIPQYEITRRSKRAKRPGHFSLARFCCYFWHGVMTRVHHTMPMVGYVEAHKLRPAGRQRRLVMPCYAVHRSRPGWALCRLVSTTKRW